MGKAKRLLSLYRDHKNNRTQKLNYILTEKLDLMLPVSLITDCQ